jgi:twitching motility protein PilT
MRSCGDPDGVTIDDRLDQWIEALAASNGSDILLTADSPPLGRVDGRLRPLAGAPVLADTEVDALVRRHMTDEQYLTLRREREVDFSFSWRDRARIRGNAFYQRGQCAVSLRRIPMDIPTCADVGLPESVIRTLHQPSGLVLVTGPTGSGKSTTLAAMIDEINQRRECHIVTIEDPIEYLHTNKRAAISQREIGTDTKSFARALKSVLREDPDVVLVGEMRDPESIAATLTIAETGHLVLATLHTNDSAQAVDRIVDVFSAEGRPQIQVQLAGTLLAVIYQRLVAQPVGGMVAAYEVMMGVPAVRNLVREGKTRQLRNVIATHRADGMQTLEHHLSALVASGTIDYQTAVDASLFPAEIVRPPHLTGSR